MALVGSCFEERFYNFFMPLIKNPYGVSALAGNWRKECGFKANNLQNSFQKKLGHTDESYTKAVDDGSYQNFVHDGAGYGCAQWTYWSRKQGLLNYAKEKGVSIGDEEMQFEYAWKELSQGYKSVLSALKTAKSVKEASYIVLTQYERPANQGEKEQAERTSYGEEFYKKYALSEGGTTMSNSALVTCTVKSPNHSGKRTKKLCRITPHCVVGQLKAKNIGYCFDDEARQASCNYGIGTEGDVCLIVDEANRSWCSSSNDNDQQAVTIECASDRTHPYAMNTKVYNKLIELCVDICRRNGKTKLLWLGSKEKTLAYKPKDDEMVLTAHRWFANKSCPGDWLYSRFGELAKSVTAALGGVVADDNDDEEMTFPKTPFTVNVLIHDLNYRSQPSMSGTVKGQTGKGCFTIVEVKDGWGKLKSGAGWIYLENPEYCTINGSVAVEKKEETTRTYVVQKGDSLWKIAAKQLGKGARYTEIKTLNGMKNNTIHAGQVLKIPAK